VSLVWNKRDAYSTTSRNGHRVGGFEHPALDLGRDSLSEESHLDHETELPPFSSDDALESRERPRDDPHACPWLQPFLRRHLLPRLEDVANGLQVALEPRLIGDRQRLHDEVRLERQSSLLAVAEEEDVRRKERQVRRANAVLRGKAVLVER